tara:strand:- start:62352 stop:64277 length:1926 start_codon:yes stop_codon:yes gene_type:complete
MDKNTLLGLLLIGAIVIGFNILNGPSEEYLVEQRRISDSIAQVEAVQPAVVKEQAQKTESSFNEVVDTLGEKTVLLVSDSATLMQQNQLYGAFAAASVGDAKEFEIETDLMKLTFSTRGGGIKKAVLTKYFRYAEDGEQREQLILFDSTSNFNLNFFTRDSKEITTDELIFTTESSDFNVNGDNEKTISFKLNAGPDRYIEYIYKVKGNDYMIDFDVNLVEMDQVMDMRSGEVYVNWMVNAPNQEKSLKPQRDATTIFYKYKNEDVDDLGISDEREDLETSMKWVSLKQQFFNTTLIADEYFDKSKGYMETITDEGESKYVKKLTVALTMPLSGSKMEKFGMAMYLGPNKYDLLKDHANELQDIINLGWGIFGWVNQFAVIPVFHFLEDFDWNYGIIILILTILLKLVLMPITYKTYLSGAKMRVLKPEISEINDKFKDDAMKKQQATMKLYRQTGVNPLSGCIPLLIQMPILFAMFRFFPASIELRQESFLWADDLSTYDSIYSFPAGFEIPWYGDHISLFTILMAISIAFYTKMNSQMSGTMTEGPMAAQMKIMTYLMPVMMLFFFNNYSSGLSYYYLLANVISIGQTILIRKVFINEDSIRAKIEVNKKKPKNQKKSGFQRRLEDMSKQQQAKLKNKK